MNHTRLSVLAVIISVVIVIGFLFSMPRTTRDGLLGEKNPSTNETPKAPIVAIRDSFKKGTHTFSGSLTVSNACTSVNAEANLSGDASSTQKIVVMLTAPEDTGICLQVPTNIPFTAKLAAPANLPVIVTVNGMTASTTSP